METRPLARNTFTARSVLRALLAHPGPEIYGRQVIEATGLQAGTVYPILHRLEAGGWLASRWEDPAACAGFRPPRRYYQLTPDGAVQAAEAVKGRP